jgi:hypothetical protein
MNLQDSSRLGEGFEPSGNAQSADPSDPHAFPALGYQYTTVYPPSATWYHDDLSAIGNIHLVQTTYGADWTNAAPRLMINQTNAPSDQNYPLDRGFIPDSSMAASLFNVDQYLLSGLSNAQDLLHDNQPTIGIPCVIIPDNPHLSCRRVVHRNNRGRAGRRGSGREQSQRYLGGPDQDLSESGRRGTPEAQIAPRETIDWENWKEQLKHMYLDLNLTANEICFELELVYNMDIA